MQSNDTHEKGVKLTEEYVTDFLESIDCYIMGSKTYEHALELGWPYGDKPVKVLTSRDLKKKHTIVEFVSGDLVEIVENLKQHYNTPFKALFGYAVSRV